MNEKFDRQKIYDYLKDIPKGYVVTYGQIANYLGNKNFSRAVGNALHYNKDGDKYPCYKVVNANGELSKNYAFGGITMQKKRLEEEHIVVREDRVDLKTYQWNKGL